MIRLIPIFIREFQYWTICVLAPEKQALTCAVPKGVIHLALHSTRLEGTMNLSDGTLWRNISLEKYPAR